MPSAFAVPPQAERVTQDSSLQGDKTHHHQRMQKSSDTGRLCRLSSGWFRGEKGWLLQGRRGNLGVRAFPEAVLPEGRDLGSWGWVSPNHKGSQKWGWKLNWVLESPDTFLSDKKKRYLSLKYFHYYASIIIFRTCQFISPKTIK